MHQTQFQHTFSTLSPMSDFVGKTISLISKKNLRYVGILENINADDATIALKSVRMFGTEGRLGQPHLEVPPGNDIYDYVVFRGNDVEDLSVLDVPIEQVRPVYPPIGTSGLYPTPTSQQPPYPQQFPPQPTSTNVNQPGPSPAQAATAPTETSGAVPREQPQPTKTTQEQPPTKSTNETEPGSLPNEAAKENIEEKDVAQSQPGSRPKPKHTNLDFKEDFDFEQSNAKFQREVKEQDEGPKYNKQSSFFDSISSSTEEKGNNRNRWAEERNLNFDTFGESGARGGRGRGRGRGGRGRGRGRGRGNWRGRSEPKPEWA
ncbi:hypothetical protein CORT_0A06110 [Candida orthopsilosis Co 90-125]|uniref:Uncharacterized protein n=1 Tax=Candida orthopsilosis (strain 90-125) TaxID=1136231 RepID=H8WY51_CANO9|nr:hypothetical protein CORT_0A06110 [Candida orthopsilosis Co 90-125]CCG20998.1 hypothetical protein CORT_0A06110 [Candida orthopsilosis Co 90-125]